MTHLERLPMLFVLPATLWSAGCDQGDSGPWPVDAVADTGSEVPDGFGDVPADTGADAGDVTDDGGTDVPTTSGPGLLYSGPRDEGAVVPGWSPDRPKPLVVFSRYSSETTWHVSMAEVDASGVVGGMVTDVVRFWGWGDLSADAPSLLFEGSLASSSIPGWSADSPLPLIILSRHESATTWFVSMAEVSADGLVGGITTAEVKVWGWPTEASPGSPRVLHDGTLEDASVAGWSVADPPPLIVLAHAPSSTDWWVSMAEVYGDGSVGGIVTDRVRIWGW